ncbi:MAG: AAA family ATPase [Mangrovibacterium sp.]
MATAEQIKSLINSHFTGSDERFATIALQIAAHEARSGRTNVAEEIKRIVDQSKARILKLNPFQKDLQGLIIESIPNKKLNDLVISNDIKNRLHRILTEYKQRHKLQKFGLSHRRKILLAGPPGTGKTMTASVLANEMHLPLFIVSMDKMVTKYMGETGAKLRLIFEAIKERNGIYLFDEFDAIGAERGNENEVGEMRRVLNAFLQFIENDFSESLIIAATNNLSVLDPALFRRFDDVIYFKNPDKAEVILLLKNLLGSFIGTIDPSSISNEIEGLSHAEISLGCVDAIKDAILKDKTVVNKDTLLAMIQDRHHIHSKQL